MLAVGNSHHAYDLFVEYFDISMYLKQALLEQNGRRKALRSFLELVEKYTVFISGEKE